LAYPVARRLEGNTLKQKGTVTMSSENLAFHVPADTGPSYWGPGDRYTFLVTGDQTNGAYFIMEAHVPPQGGPPPHFHPFEEAFYILEGTLDVRLGENTLKASTGDFVQIPRGTVHAFRNNGNTMARMLIFASPAGLEKYFEEVLEPVQDRSAAPPAVTAAWMTHFVEAGRRHGIEFV
jgi:quercetin dioxygenase-like cupin family protein